MIQNILGLLNPRQPFSEDLLIAPIKGFVVLLRPNKRGLKDA